MSLIVAKAFNTTNRRFREGQSITEADLAGDVMPVEDRRRRRFVVGAATKAAASIEPKEEAPAEAPSEEKPRRR